MKNDLQFLHYAHYPHCVAEVDKFFDGYYSLQLMIRGEIDLSYDNACQTLIGAWYWSAFPGPRIRFHATANAGWWEHRYVAFRGRLATRWRADGLLLSNPRRCLSPTADTHAFDRLLATLEHKQRWSHLSAINYLERMLIDLAEHPHDSGSLPWLTRVTSILSDSLERTLDYEQVAHSLDLGFSTFRRLFKLQTGQTPHEYRLNARMGAARELLSRTDTPVKQVARQLGYADVFYFSRQFRVLTGLPPSAYRQSVQK